jgi:hypothetical protein
MCPFCQAEPVASAFLSVAAKKGTILAAMAATGPQPFTWSLSLLTGGLVQNGPESVKGAPLLGAATRTLDGEDRSEIIRQKGKAPARVPQGGSRKVVPSSPPLTTCSSSDGFTSSPTQFRRCGEESVGWSQLSTLGPTNSSRNRAVAITISMASGIFRDSGTATWNAIRYSLARCFVKDQDRPGVTTS